jgi:hypothetical protein
MDLLLFLLSLCCHLLIAKIAEGVLVGSRLCRGTDGQSSLVYGLLYNDIYVAVMSTAALARRPTKTSRRCNNNSNMVDIPYHNMVDDNVLVGDTTGPRTILVL